MCDYSTLKKHSNQKNLLLFIIAEHCSIMERFYGPYCLYGGPPVAVVGYFSISMLWDGLVVLNTV